MEEELLPKPELDLPLPEKEIPPHSASRLQGQALEAQSHFFKSKLFISFVVISFLVAFLIGGFVLGRNNASKPTPLGSPEPTAKAATPTLNPTANWKTYTNTKHNYSFRLPNSFSIVKGPAGDLPDSEFQKVDGIAFDGMQESSDPNAGVVIGIQVNPADANGDKIICSSNDSCLNKWTQVLKKSPSQVNSVSKIIANQNTKGIEYENNNDLYSQTAMYYSIFQNNKFYLISLVWNNYSKNEVEKTLDQILSTFKFTQ